MGNSVFGIKCWSWNLLHHGVRILHIQHVSPLLPYLPILHLIPSPTVPYFKSSLIQCKLTVLYLLDYTLHCVQSKTLFE